MQASTPQRANDFLDKAARLLGWLRTTEAEIAAHGRHARLAEIERLFFVGLELVCTLHEALLTAAGAADLQPWRARLESLRQGDALLKYLWKARDFSVHGRLIACRRDGRLFEVEIVDVQKARPIAVQFNAVPPPVEEQLRRLAFHVYRVDSFAALMARLEGGEHPDIAVLQDAGIEMRGFPAALALQPFEVRIAGATARIDPPAEHLGEAIDANVEQALGLAMAFYAERFAELRVQVPLPGTGGTAA